MLPGIAEIAAFKGLHRTLAVSVSLPRLTNKQREAENNKTTHARDRRGTSVKTQETLGTCKCSDEIPTGIRIFPSDKSGPRTKTKTFGIKRKTTLNQNNDALRFGSYVLSSDSNDYCYLLTDMHDAFLTAEDTSLAHF